MSSKTPQTPKTTKTRIPPEVDNLFRRMADEAPGVLSVRSVGRGGLVRMRHEIAGRRGRRPYLERQDFTILALSVYQVKKPTVVLFEVAMKGAPAVMVSGVPSAVLAVVRR